VLEAISKNESKELEEGNQEEEHASHGFEQPSRKNFICRGEGCLHYSVEGCEISQGRERHD